MKIAVSAKGPALSSEIAPHFGRANYFVVVNTNTGELSAHDNSQNMRAAHGGAAHAAQHIITCGVEGLITGNITADAATALKAGNVQIYKQTWGTVRDGIERFKSGRLSDGGPTCSVGSVSINGTPDEDTSTGEGSEAETT
jgi:predicted Fe-Mo cluster-binding NifX family protein